MPTKSKTPKQTHKAPSDRSKPAGAARRSDSDMRAILQQRGSTRDEALAFITERLNTITTLQEREHALIDPVKQRQWFKSVADQQKTQATAPDPTRWRAVAGLYEDATIALSMGHLGRGRALLKMAHAAEDSVFNGMTSLVDTDNVDHMRSPALAPLHPSEAKEGCTPTDATELVASARQIQGVTVTASLPPNRGRPKRPRWAIALEEEEEEHEETPE